MEINSKTILKSILGSIVQFTQAIQIEHRIKEIDAKNLAYNTIITGLKTTLNIKEDQFINHLNSLITQYKDNKDMLLIVLRIKDYYETNCKI